MAPWFSPESTSNNSSPWEKNITKDVTDLSAHTFFILNHLLKFIRALASSVVNSSLSTESQTKLLKDLKPRNFDFAVIILTSIFPYAYPVEGVFL